MKRGAIVALALATSSVLCGCTTPSSTTYLDWPVETASHKGAFNTVVVHDGDTVAMIAARYNVSEEKLLLANDLSRQSAIYPGDVLNLPRGTKAPEREAAREEHIEQHSLKPVRVARLDPPFTVTTAPLPERRPSEHAADKTPVPDHRPSQPERTADLHFIWPVEGSIISHFGEGPGGERNDGINISTYPGAPVRAAAAGTVTYAGNELRRYGNLIIIKHDDGYITVYAHEKSISVTKGQQVERGETIGRAGDTGAVERPQLHFEVRYDTAPVNPQPLLGPASGKAAS